MANKNCPFCTIQQRDILKENAHCFAIFDRYPVSQGHALIITHRHVTDVFGLTHKERESCWSLITEIKALVEAKYDPDGWNIGMNCEATAGQTVFHFHCHLIPRYEGDMEDPRGGVRHAVEGKGYY